MTRKVLTTTAVVAAVAGLGVLAQGTAAASVAEPQSCNAAVTGQIGEQVTLDGTAVKELVRTGAREAKTVFLLHDLTIWPDHVANEIAKKQLIVGSVPDAQSGTVNGEVIGAAVRDALRGSAGLGALPATQESTLTSIANTVAGNCGLSLFASNYVAPTTPKSEQPPADPSTPQGTPAAPTTQPGPATGLGSGSLEGTGLTTVPPRDYSGIPTASAPSAGLGVPPSLRYPPSNGVPGSPELGVLGADGGQDSREKATDVRTAGNADALATPASTSQVQLPMLLAVVVLAAVTAALVRTWVLRRVA
ncbi:hypothetical protein ABZ863_20600 [Saccharomonospora sp. NPDC046836]|uniref:hypothetical protein n=1 Tax=Saccharomonospora sp. NPDC046836 TaxID=3156921 RepID=UPI003409374A